MHARPSRATYCGLIVVRAKCHLDRVTISIKENCHLLQSGSLAKVLLYPHHGITFVCKAKKQLSTHSLSSMPHLISATLTLLPGVKQASITLSMPHALRLNSHGQLRDQGQAR